MKTVGFMSDTHGNVVQTRKAFKIMDDYSCDIIIHTGDVLSYGYSKQDDDMIELLNSKDNITFTRGNSDYFSDFRNLRHDMSKYERLIDLGGRLVLASHGYRKSINEYIALAENLSAKIFVSGHTHVSKIELKNNIIALNPGSVGKPRDGINSIAIMKNDDILLIDVNTEETFNYFHINIWKFYWV